MARAAVIRPAGHEEVVTAPGDDPLLGRTLDGRFRVVELIGVGGMGRVYRAVQARLNRPVALKVLNKGYGAASDDSFRKRFYLEASLTAQLRHPNVVTVIDYGVTRQGVFYIAMEYLEGETLIDVLSRTPCLPWRRALGIGQQIARGVREAHRLGVVHRDLKPGNVMLLSAATDQDLVKVLDFGLVKSFVQRGSNGADGITEHGVLMGSPQYMAPEQAEKNHADPRSDVYSLGVLLYELMVGRPPFLGRHHLDVMLKHVNDRVPSMAELSGGARVPDAVEDLVLWCLEKDPSRRPQSMDEVLAALQRILEPTAAESVADSRPPPRSRGWSAGVVASLLFLAAAGLGIAAAGFVAPRLRAELAPPAAVPAPDGVVVSTLAPQPPPPSGLERIHFRIASEPPGAQVRLKGRSLGTTPVEFDMPPGPEGTAKAELELTLHGYLPLTVTAGGFGPWIDLIQKLQPLPEAVPVAVGPVEISPAPKRPPPPAPARKKRHRAAKERTAKALPALKPLPPPVAEPAAPERPVEPGEGVNASGHAIAVPAANPQPEADAEGEQPAEEAAALVEPAAAAEEAAAAPPSEPPRE